MPRTATHVGVSIHRLVSRVVGLLAKRPKLNANKYGQFGVEQGISKVIIWITKETDCCAESQLRGRSSAVALR